MASRYGTTTRLTASALTAHNQATDIANGTNGAGSGAAAASTSSAAAATAADGWRAARATNGGSLAVPPHERASRSGSASSAESSASDLVKPKYERQLLSEYGRIKQRNPSRSEAPAAVAAATNRLSSASSASLGSNRDSVSSSTSFKSFSSTSSAPYNSTGPSTVYNSNRDSLVSSVPYNNSRDSSISSAPYNSQRESTVSSSYNSNRDTSTGVPFRSNLENSSVSFNNRSNGDFPTSFRNNRDNVASALSHSSNRDGAPTAGTRGAPSAKAPPYAHARDPAFSYNSHLDRETAATTREALLSSRSRDGSDPRGSSSSSSSSSVVAAPSSFGTLPSRFAPTSTSTSTSAPAKNRDGRNFEFDDGFVIKPPHMNARASRDYDDEVFSAEPATVTAAPVTNHHSVASVTSVASASSAGSRPAGRAWSTYKPPASASARAMARAAAPPPADAPRDPSPSPSRSSSRSRSRSPGLGVAPATPTRTEWNYREGGVLVQEVDEGQPCLTCHEKCPGFTPHMWRKTCNSCKCPREAHDVYHEEWVNVRERLGFEPSSGPPGQPGGGGGGGRERSRAEGYAWVPPGLPSHKIEEYFAQLPAGKVPKLSTAGEKYRDRQLVLQLPKQDLALAYCKHVEAQHSTSYEDFISARNEIALDIGYVADCTACTKCPQCRQMVEPGEVAVVAPKLGPQTAWHPACFICCSCQELLVDLTYCVHDDQLYCERHYAEQLKPRCAACDELIFSGEYTKAMSKDWHSGHFCCWQCDESLTGQRYVLRDDHPYCIKCYESVFANVCEECNRTIGIDSKDLSYKDKHWHEACFLCTKCRVSLVDKQFGSKADKIYCGNCYDAQFASRCDGCGEIFRAGTKKMEYKTRQWHEKCFCCCVCKSAIGTKSFIPREQEIYCAGCYEEKFATRCVKCNKIITSGGVTYKNEPWHRECFTCTNCNTSLAGQRFTSRDEKPYCADCFGELFAKRCTACSKPITGIGGTRFISFEDRHWHNDCFICASCKTSLVGRGFITDAEDIICPECAKQKLM